MKWIDTVIEYLKNFSTYFPTMDLGDIAEILIIALLLYYLMVWMKTTRAWALMKGIIVIFAFLLFAYFCKMSTILWMAENVLGFAVTALIVVLQPELRSALEQLEKRVFLRLYFLLKPIVKRKIFSLKRRSMRL